MQYLRSWQFEAIFYVTIWTKYYLSPVLVQIILSSIWNKVIFMKKSYTLYSKEKLQNGTKVKIGDNDSTKILEIIDIIEHAIHKLEKKN